MPVVTASAEALLAHQGGWDEVLMVAVPMVVVGWLLWLAKRRVDRAAAVRSDAPPADTGPGTDIP